jgi:carbonic anhydrase
MPEDNITPAGLLPADRNYSRQRGPLARPPRSKGMRWLLVKDRLTVSAQPIAGLRTAPGYADNLPGAAGPGVPRR